MFTQQPYTTNIVKKEIESGCVEIGRAMRSDPLVCCSPACVSLWNKHRPRVPYVTWLQTELYRTLDSPDPLPPPDLCEVVHEAVSAGHVHCTRELLDLGFSPDNRKVGGHETALITAVRSGQTDCVRMLLRAGADVNWKDANGMTALMYSVLFRNEACTELILDAGADANVKCRTGQYMTGSAVSLAAMQDQLRLFKVLLRSFARSNFRNPVDSQWLMDVVTEKPVFYARKVLECIIDEFGGLPWSAYEHITFEDKHVLLRYLIERNLPLLEGRRVDLRKLLYCCIESPEGGQWCLRELMESRKQLGLDFSQYLFDTTLLQYACELLNHQAVSLLLTTEVDADARSIETNETPLKECLRSMIRNPMDGIHCVLLLLKHGCDPEQKFETNCSFPPGVYNLSPIEYALSGRNLYVAEVLMSVLPTNRAPSSPHLKGRLRETIIPFPLQATQTDVEEFVKRFSTPRSLYQVTRASIRRLLGTRPQPKIRLLPVPEDIKKFLELADLDVMMEDLQEAVSFYSTL